MTDDLASGFKDVDRAADFAVFASCLDLIESMPFFAEGKRESFGLLGAAPGRRILDVGCGLGDDAAALAALVATGGAVVGVANVSRQTCQFLAVLKEPIDVGIRRGFLAELLLGDHRAAIREFRHPLQSIPRPVVEGFQHFAGGVVLGPAVSVRLAPELSQRGRQLLLVVLRRRRRNSVAEGL